eukprot:g38231.t1
MAGEKLVPCFSERVLGDGLVRSREVLFLEDKQKRSCQHAMPVWSEIASWINATVRNASTGLDAIMRYHKGKECLVPWSKDNNLSLNVRKTKELIIDFRRKRRRMCPIYINGARFVSIKFLGMTITNNLFCPLHVDTMVKEEQQHLFFLRRLRKFDMSTRTLTNFYRGTIESILY